MNQSQDKLGATKENFDPRDDNFTQRTTQQSMRTSMGHPLGGTGMEAKNNNFMIHSTFDSDKPQPIKKRKSILSNFSYSGIHI